MAWYDEAVFYHIYPLGLTGAPMHNDYGGPQPRLRTLFPWIDHMAELGCNALYIGPLFESQSHGYDTTDYRKLDSRLGTNQDFKDFVAACHGRGIRVVLDGVFNHTGRDFFAFRDIQEHREDSQHRDWYCGVDFRGDTEYQDGFSYENWGGYNLLAKLNQRNPAVREYLCDTVKFWVSEFDIDGIRLDAADVLDFDFMRALRRTADTVKADFWLMGEVIHGDYGRWLAPGLLHSVTNYRLHKALYSGHNDHNYFEIAHTVRETNLKWKLYNFVDNHDVARIASKLSAKANLLPVHVLLYTLPGIPSVYYGSEFGIEGKKERWSDASLRPEIHLEDFRDNDLAKVIAALGCLRKETPVFAYGDYEEKLLTNKTYAFTRSLEGLTALVAVNNANNGEELFAATLPQGTYTGWLTGQKITTDNGGLRLTLPPHSGEIWLPEGVSLQVPKPVTFRAQEEPTPTETKSLEPRETNKPFDQMTVEELQQAILAKMEKNGPITQRMYQDVAENVYRDSLLNWVRSFR